MDNNGVLDEVISNNNNNELNLNSYNQNLKIFDSDSSEKLENSEPKIIYIGHHNTTVGGNGSYDNPFTTFKAACDIVNGEDNIIINVFNGTYYLGEGLPKDANTPLKFNTNNLNINGINGTVFIKNYFNDNRRGLNAEAFSLTSSSANFTFSNIIFDFTGSTVKYMEDNKYKEYNFVLPFWGNANLGIFYNCSFILPNNVNTISGSEFNSKFIKCSIIRKDEALLFVKDFATNSTHSFEYCIFNYDSSALATIRLPCDISFDSVWFGQNTIPSFIGPFDAYAADPDGSWNTTYTIPVNRYAKLSISSNYLGNNQYEILGKLTWNGTDDQDGMENFQPMIVKLTSGTGVINSTATLVNGNFKTIYTSSNTTHIINYILDHVDEDLIFTTVNITSKEASIYYGEDQNITVNLTQAINNNIAIVVSNATFNKTYIVKVNDSSSFTYTIPDRLKAGTYDINITLSEGNLVGFNTTTLTVSKVSDYTFEVVPNSPKFGENATITITLPDDVNGTVTVKLGNETLPTLEANQTMDVNFAKLNVDTYNITVTYRGSDKYTQDEKTASLTVNPAESSVEINDAAFIYGETIAIPFNMTNAIGVNVTVYNKDDEIATASSTSGIITLDTLPAGEYSLYVKTVVDDEVNYQWADATVNLTINKANSTLEISDQEFAYASQAVINAVTVNSTGDLIATLIDENNNEIPVIDISGDNITLPLLDVGKYTLNVTTNVDENHNNVTKSATITIIKTTPLMNVIVEPSQNITAKDNPTLTIKLPSDATGEVVIKVNGKKVQDSTANETITIDLDNNPGDYIVDIIYSGDKNYESDSATKEFTISKAETSITAEQISFEAGNTSKIEVTVPDVNSGIVLVDVADKKFYGDINNGKANVTIEGVDAGNYTANIKFFGDELYKEATCTADVKVSEPKIITELKEQLEEAQANATQLKDELDNVSGQLVDAQANATQLKEDFDELNQTVAGKDAEISNLTDVVAGKDAEISNLTDVVAGKDAEISNLTDVVAGKDAEISNLTDVVAGKDAEISNLTDVVAGKDAEISNLTDVVAGKDAEISNLTDAVSVKDSVIDSQTEQIGNLNDTVNDLRAIIDSLKDQNVTVVVDGQEYAVEVVNGTATIETNKTEPKKASEFSEITIGDNQTVSLVLKDEDGNVIANAPITYTVNGAVNTTTTDKDGKFTIQGENGALITINYVGNANITGTNTTLKLNSQAVPEVVKVAAHFNISDRAITIKGYAVDGPAGEQGIYYATTVLDENGNPIPNVYIEFAVNNKIYNRTTDENGTFNPYKLNMVRAGRYTMAFNYAGDDNYTNAFACVCVDLDKKPITIKAPAKTYKAAAKTKKYTVTLSTIPSVHDGKVYISPKKVTLKVNGKTYTGKTNNNGQVTFKITNLNKKGKYTAKISYEGDKTYESATQKVKLNIK